jgi:lipoate-protein ligase B
MSLLKNGFVVVAVLLWVRGSLCLKKLNMISIALLVVKGCTLKIYMLNVNLVIKSFVNIVMLGLRGPILQEKIYVRIVKKKLCKNKIAHAFNLFLRYNI